MGKPRPREEKGLAQDDKTLGVQLGGYLHPTAIDSRVFVLKGSLEAGWAHFLPSRGPTGPLAGA